MFGWHHWLNGHESEQTPGDDERQGGLECYSPWHHKESDTTWQLNNNILNQWKEVHFLFVCFFVCFHVYLAAPGLSCSM